LCGNIKSLSRNVQLLRQVKTLIEKHYCKDKQIVTQLTPSMIRIMSLMKTSKKEKSDPIGEESGEIDKSTGCDLVKLVKSTQVRFDDLVMHGFFPDISNLLN